MKIFLGLPGESEAGYGNVWYFPVIINYILNYLEVFLWLEVRETKNIAKD